MDAALPLLADLATFIFVASLKGSALVAAVLLAQKVAGKYLTAGIRYLLWFTVVAGLVTPVGFDAALLPEASSAPAAASSRALPANDYAASSASVADATYAPAQTTFSSPATSVRRDPAGTAKTLSSVPMAWLHYLWLAGVLVVSIAIAVSSYRFARILERASPASSLLQNLLRECARQTGCTAPIRTLQSPDVQVPMIAGQFRPVLLLPAGLELQLTRAQLRHIFIHELMHLQRGDILSNWLVAVLQALHWFNPVVWYAFFRMRQDRELACDAATLKHLAPSERAAYGHTLLQLNDALPAALVPVIALGILESSSHLQERIVMLMQTSRSREARMLLTSMLFAPLVAFAFSQPVPREAAPVESASVVVEVAPAAIEPARDIVEPVAVPAPVAALTIEPVPEPAALAPASPAVQELIESVAVEVELLAPVSTPVIGEEIAREPIIASDVQPAPAHYARLEELQQLSADIAAEKAAKLRFIEEWDSTAGECAARRERFLGSVSKPCRQTTMALARGEIFRFAYECFLLNTHQAQLRHEYEEAAAERQASFAGVEELLSANEQSLAEVCSKQTFARDYPAFADIFAEAESLESYPRRRRTNTLVAGFIPHIVGMDHMYASAWVSPSSGGPAFNGNPYGAGDMGSGGAAATGTSGEGAASAGL